MQFEWDSIKSAGNFTKHGVSFDEASTFLAIRWRCQLLIPIIRLMRIAS